MNKIINRLIMPGLLVIVSIFSVSSYANAMQSPSIQTTNLKVLYATSTSVVSPVKSIPTKPFQMSESVVNEISTNCYKWTTNLKIGDQNEKVASLTRVLVKEGFLNSSDIAQNNGMIFDEKVASAVVGFQQKYASEILTPNGLTNGTGYVGPATRKKLNQISDCGEAPIVATSITVLSPNGGEIWNTNTTQTIKWYDNSSVTSSCPEGINCMSPAPKNYNISLLSSDGTTYPIASNVMNSSYSWNIGSTIVGSYRIQICQIATNQCDTSDSYMTISNGKDTYIPPTISDSIDSQNPGAGLVLATDASLVVKYLPDVKEDHAGAWEQFRANGNTDYANRGILTLNSTKTIKNILFSTNVRGLAGFTSITQKVDGIGLYPAVVFYNGSQINTAYDQLLGTYGPGTHVFTVFDESSPYDMPYSTFGLTFYFTDGTYVTATTPGTVGNNTGGNQVSDPIIYPKGGENYQIGGQIEVKWNPNNFVGSNVGLILRRANTGSNFPADSGAQAQRIPNTGSYTMTIGNIGEGGQYYLRIVCDPYSNCNYADSKMFTINSNSQPTTLQVITPNGGESYVVGSIINGNFKTTLPVGTSYDVSIVGKAYDQQIATGIVNSSGIQSFAGIIPPVTTETQYRIRIACSSCSELTQDQSDSTFTITPKQITPPSNTITLSTPNGGEIWTKGSTQNITWQDSFTNQICPVGAYCSPPAPRYYNIKAISMKYMSSYPINSNTYGRSYSWTIGSNIPSGPYRIQVCTLDGIQCDSSNANLNIIEAYTSTTTSAIQYPAY